MTEDDNRRHAGAGHSNAARLASARSAIDAFIVMDVMREAHLREAAGETIVHMEVGQPGTPAPRMAREAAKRAIDTELLGYTDAFGIAPLRERIARHYAEQHGISVDPGRIIVTTGSSAGFVLAFLALFDTGARVALPSPGYPCYRHIATALGCEPVILEANSTTRWMPSPRDIAEQGARGGAPLDGLLLASPANPTGTMLPRERLKELVAACTATGTHFISDEIYHGLEYEMPAASALEFSADAIVINSFSKYFSMTGWRVGWMVLPEFLVRPVERLMQNLFISAPAVSQAAALAAFDATEELDGHKAVYAENRQRLLDALPAFGFTEIVPPDGAFYIYADASHLADDTRVLARSLLQEAGVAVTPGIDFDARRGSKFLRFSYARQTADIIEGIARLEGWFKRR